MEAGGWNSDKDWKSILGPEAGSGVGRGLLEGVAPNVPLFVLMCRLLYSEQPRELVSGLSQLRLGQIFSLLCRYTLWPLHSWLGTSRLRETPPSPGDAGRLDHRYYRLHNWNLFREKLLLCDSRKFLVIQYLYNVSFFSLPTPPLSLSLALPHPPLSSHTSSRELHSACQSLCLLKPHPPPERLYWQPQLYSYRGRSERHSGCQWWLVTTGSGCSGCQDSSLHLLLSGRLWEDALAFVEQESAHDSQVYSALCHSLLVVMVQVYI